ncbi:hypothetical protein BROUX41_005972 [Berkeleyomyces rouxiae]|uniref:uncharacterized protein n=1 Tax=Berkeleyomyces rouxiae TaxID=2035830 RepID=UPI003B7E9DB0
MIHSRAVVDGLWKCLCPASADSTLLASRATHQRLSHASISAATTSRPAGLAATTPPNSLATARQAVRPFTSSRLVLDSASPDLQNERTVPEIRGDAPAEAEAHVAEPPSSLPDPMPSLPTSRPNITVSQLATTQPPYRELKDASLRTIYETFQRLRGRTHSMPRISAFLDYIIKYRPTKLRFYHYNLLLEALADRKGSAKTVRILLQEMKEAGIQPKPLTYHNVLAALAIHPDYTLRNEVLREMRERWISKSVLDECYEAVGLLRDTQYEMALEKLESMIKDAIFIPPWLFEVFGIVFCNAGFLDEAYQILTWRLNAFRNPPPAYILHMLETFSQGYHYEGTKLLWHRVTRTNRLHPSDIAVQHVIHTGARYGDPGLILQAIDLLASRGTEIGLVQFEPLLDCYALVGDMENALRVFSLMSRVGIKLRRPSTRSIFSCLRNKPELIQSYMDALHDADSVPIAAVNVLLEVLHSFEDGQTAMDVYKSISNLTNEPASSETFGYLVDLTGDPSALLFLADEASMVVQKLQIRTTLLHKLANACADAGKLDLAVKYFTRVNEEWRSQVTKTQKKLMKDAYRITFQNVFRALLKARDTRAAIVLRLGKARMAMLGAGLRRELDATWPEVWDEIQHKRHDDMVKREAAREEEGVPADVNVHVPLPEELDTLYDQLKYSAQFEDEPKPEAEPVERMS